VPESPIALLHEWHDFYILIATVSATIIGSMFVVASIASVNITPQSVAQGRIYLSPIVMHLSTIVFACAIVMVPRLGAWPFGIIFGLGGLVGLAYSAYIAMRVGKSNLDLEDRLWYAVVPVAAYLTMVAGAILILRQEAWALETLAAALAVLLVTGIRNAWDLTLFYLTRVRGQS
jgi:hypothetical protein